MSHVDVPDDIILCLLDHIPIEDALRFMALSTRFRRMVLSHSVYWRDIGMTSWTPGGVKLLKVRLERSYGRCVNVFLHITVAEGNTIVQIACMLVKDHISHIGSLHICGMGGRCTPVTELLGECGTAPMLHSLLLHAGMRCASAEQTFHTMHIYEIRALPDQFVAPLLRNISLAFVSLPSAAAAWCANVEELRLTGNGHYLWSRVRVLFPRLLILGFADRGALLDHSSDTTAPGAPIEQLSLYRGTDPPSWAALVSRVAIFDVYPNKKIDHIIDRQFSSGELLALIQAPGTHTLVGCTSKKEMVLVKLRVTKPCLSAALFARILTLELHVRMLSSGRQFFSSHLALSVLETLVIRFTSGVWKGREESVDPAQRTTRKPYLTCPVLKIVVLQSSSKDCRVDGVYLAAALQDVLVTDGSRFDPFPTHIHTEGVELIGDLEDMADVFSVCPSTFCCAA